MMKNVPPRLAKVYELAINDEDYCNAMSATKGNFVPHDTDKPSSYIAFSVMYCGWQLSRLSEAEYNAMVEVIEFDIKTNKL